MTLMTAVGAEVKSHLPCPPKSIVAFSEKMAKAGFTSRNLAVELPNSEAYEKLSNGELRRMNFLYRWGYELKSFFKDDMSGSKFPEGIYIFNRNQNGEKSNFFVLARYTSMHGVQIMFSNPLGPNQKAEDGKTGMDLKKDEVLLNLTCGMRTAKGFDVWADQVIAQIQKMASYKPENTYYAQAHGHWGYARGKLLMDLKIDDGRSHEMDVIMNMVLAHTDFDATGPHNHHYRPLFQDVSALEAAAGIVKVPACEVTMPIHLYDNYSVEHFVRILNERKDDINTLVGELNARRAELEKGIDSINRAIDSLGKQVDSYESQIKVHEFEINSLKGKRKAHSAYDMKKRDIDNRISDHEDQMSEKKYKRLSVKQEIKEKKDAMFAMVREMGELGPAKLQPLTGVIELPEKTDGRYDIDSVNAMLSSYGPTAKAYNSRPENKLTPVPLPEPEPNGPHVTMYANSEERMQRVMTQFLSNRALEYPPFAAMIEMEDFMQRTSSDPRGSVAFGMAHPACSKSLPAVDILRRISLGDISLAKAEEVMRDRVQLVAAFNDTISRKEEILFIPWDEKRLANVKNDAVYAYGEQRGMELYEDEVRRAKDISEAGEFFSNLMAESDRKYGTGAKQTLNAVNLAWSYYIAEKYGLGRMYDADTHIYVPISFGRKYIGPMLYGRTAISLSNGNRLKMEPHAFVSAITSAKKGENLAKVDAEIFWDRKNDDGVPEITHERKNNTIYENLLELWSEVRVYGFAGLPYLAKDMWHLFWKEKLNSGSGQERLHYLQSAISGGENKQ